jgi:hypothetical protein
MTPPIIQHYIPQFLLRNFTDEKMIYVFDKQSQKTFRTSTRRIACENRFNECSISGEVLSLESYLAQLESEWAPIIAEINRLRSINFLTEEQRSTLSKFIAFQSVRTPRTPAQLNEIKELLSDFITKRIGNERADKVIPPKDIDVEKYLHLQIMIEHSKNIAQYIYNMDWWLLTSAPETNFVLGDSAVTLSNEYDHSPYGNIGFAVKGIKVSIPLSPTLCLKCMCKSYLQQFETNLLETKALRLISNNQALHGKDEAVTRLEEIVEAIKTQKPSACTTENMDHFNSIQVYFAERYIFSRKNDFSLAERMIKDNPKTSLGIHAQH